MAKKNIKPSAKDRKMAVELLVIGMIGGCALCPGGHIQFSFWFMSLIPLAIEMTGFPPVFTFWIYQYLYPVDLNSLKRNYHH